MGSKLWISPEYNKNLADCLKKNTGNKSRTQFKSQEYQSQSGFHTGFHCRGEISLKSIDATQLSDYMNEVLINGCDLANYSVPFEEILHVFKVSNRYIDL